MLRNRTAHRRSVSTDAATVVALSDQLTQGTMNDQRAARVERDYDRAVDQLILSLYQTTMPRMRKPSDRLVSLTDHIMREIEGETRPDLEGDGSMQSIAILATEKERHYVYC